MAGLRRCIAILAAAGGVLAADKNESIFREKILPTLQASCASCHGGATPAGSFSVGDWRGVLNGGRHGAAILPGKSSDSLLIQYLRGEKTPRMPMSGSIPEGAIAALAAAIDQMKPAPATANPYAAWLFSKPKPPNVPLVRDSAWVKNPVDAFVLSKLEARALTPAPPASRRALIRRVYFDLIGLPPTPQEVEEFGNSAAPDAYEKVIDKLLADPRYGERWGRHWLDLVRFAESDGFAI